MSYINRKKVTKYGIWLGQNIGKKHGNIILDVKKISIDDETIHHNWEYYGKSTFSAPK